MRGSFNLLRSERTRASEPKRFLTNRATESNPSLPHPAVVTRQLRSIASQSTCATSVRTIHVCTRNRRNRMCRFDRARLVAAAPRLRVLGQLTSQKRKCFGTLMAGSLVVIEKKGVGSRATWASHLPAHWSRPDISKWNSVRRRECIYLVSACSVLRIMKTALG